MPTECSVGAVSGHQVVAAFDGGTISSDAGALLLGATDRAIQLTERFAACFTDRRTPGLVNTAYRPWSRIADCNDMLDIIGAGLPDGQLYSLTRRGRSNTRWAGNILMRERDMPEGHAAQIIDSWLKSGVLEEASYRHNGKDCSGLMVNSTKRPGAQYSG